MSKDEKLHLLKKCQSANGWKRVGAFHHDGIAIPLSALHSQDSCGIGDFYDLIPLIDWCKEVKFDTIQLLPLNDSAHDPSPYNAISSCALHPIYLSLLHLPFVKKDEKLLKEIEYLKKFNETKHIAYADVLLAKEQFFKKYFHLYGKKVLHSQKAKSFIKKNEWLLPYALFKILKEIFHHTHFQTWPKEIRLHTSEAIEELKHIHNEEIEYHYLLQYLCYTQFSTIKKHANRKKIWIKGDIPILISPDSADVWYHTELFVTDFSAGAPPDFYNKEGQYWGFPLYNWKVMKNNHFAWWKTRLLYASHFYDIFRIDHVIGFFRIWAILIGRPAKEGSFVPADESLWEQQGREILQQLLSFTDMLPIAEDLGVVPDVVRPTLKQLGICSTKIMRWERLWDKNKTFILPQDYPLISMTSLSTHDSPTLAQWWRDYPEEVEPLCKQKLWMYQKTLTKDQRESILYDSHHTKSLFHINLLQEYLNLHEDLSWDSIDDERINIPGKILSTNWVYKFKPSIEELTSHSSLRYNLQKILIKNI